MGSGTFDAKAYRAYAHTTRGKSTDEIYGSRAIHKNLDPKGVKIRESRDSTDNPNSTPIIVAIDVTGSMGIIADVLAREGLGTLFKELLDTKPVSDPHLMFMAVGDANCDSAPLQVSQFEADNRIVEQLTQIFIEHGGGGNSFESYNLPWYFAANHTVHDSLIKRGKRGYLFTVGDEEAPGDLTLDQISKFIGDTPERKQSSAEMLQEAQRRYDVFHVVIKEGDHARQHLDRVLTSWNNLLGQHVIPLADHKKLAETIVAAIEVAEGAEAHKSAARFGSVVVDAVKHLPASKTARLALPN
jgi:hypothetical protein